MRRVREQCGADFQKSVQEKKQIGEDHGDVMIALERSSDNGGYQKEQIEHSEYTINWR